MRSNRLRTWRLVMAVFLLSTLAVAAGAAGPTAAAPVAATQAPSDPGAATPAPVTMVTILNFSDWHGNLRPSRPPSVREDLGGAAYLQAYFKQRASRALNAFVMTAGDEVGATPASSSLLGDYPAIEALNRMKVAANTFGNHNFDRGVEHMRNLASRARYPYVAANLRDPDGATPEWFQRSTVLNTVEGVRLGVTGAINPDAPQLVIAGGLGNLRVMSMDETAAALNAEAASLRASGIGTVIALVHMGATGPGSGPLFDLAARLRGVDLLIGDHTTLAANQPAKDADGKPIYVIQSLRNGWSFTVADLTIETVTGRTLSVDAVSSPTSTRLIAPDPEMEAFIAHVEKQSAAQRQEVVGTSTVPLPQNLGLAEANQGNLVTDAVRQRYGVDFAIQNSGALRAGFTKDQRSDGLYPITRGDVLTVLPFGDVVVTVEVSGTELKTMLENGVGAVPEMNGRFPQISGFKFGYHTLRPPGLRVAWVRWPDGRDVDLGPDARYTIAINAFMAGGGDGYGPFNGREHTREPLDQVVTEYIQANSPVSPEGPVPPATVPETRVFRLD